MTKYLKKYRNTILIFFGVFIMIVFVGQQWITNLNSQQTDRTEFTIDGRPVTARQRAEFNLRHDALERALEQRLTLLYANYSNPQAGLLAAEFAEMDKRQQELQAKMRPADGKPAQSLTALEASELFGGLQRRAQAAATDAQAVARLAPRTPTGAFRELLKIGSMSHFMLLAEEARSAGLVGNTVEPLEFGRLVAEFLAVRAWGPDWRFAPTDSAAIELREPRERRVKLWANLLGAIAGEMLGKQVQQQVLRGDVTQALAETAGVLRLVALHNESARPSRQRVAADLRRTLDRVFISHYLLTVDPERAKSQPEPTPQEVAAHVEKFKDVYPPASREMAELRARGAVDLQALPFGYKLSNRVKVKYLTLDIDELASQITRDKIETLVQEAVVAMPASEVGPEPAKLTAAETRAEDRVRWEIVRDVRTAVEREVLSARGAAEAGRPLDLAVLATRCADAGAAAARAYMRKALAGKEPPADFKPVPKLTVDAPEQWLSFNSMRADKQWQMMAVVLDVNTRRFLTLGELIDCVPEFARPNPPRVIRMGLPIVDPVSEFTSASTDFARPSKLHFFVFTEAAKASAPSLEDKLDSGKTVREQAIEDLKSLKEYESLAAVANQFAQTAGLFEFSTLAVQMQPMGITATLAENVEVSRSPRLLNPPPFAPGTDFIEQVVSKAEKLDFALPIFEMKVEDRTFTAAMPPRLSIALVQVTQFWPFYEEQLANPGDSVRPPADDYVGRFAGKLADGQVGAVGSLSFASLITRLKTTNLREGDEPAQ